MGKEAVSLNVIEDFLAQKRIAMVGISREIRDNFSVLLFNELVRRGYDVVPVNPKTSEILGRRCVARVQQIEMRVDVALLMTPPDVTDAVVRDCAEAGIRRVWMFGPGSGKGGATSESAITFCREQGIEVVAGECPFMFFPHNSYHRIHGWVRKISGSFPKQDARN